MLKVFTEPRSTSSQDGSTSGAEDQREVVEPSIALAAISPPFWSLLDLASAPSARLEASVPLTVSVAVRLLTLPAVLVTVTT
ncbi:Uncharacterised protein [Burkholderia gladioli]|nr:Uncharacterised protein [Burkholderia gladioli]